ncbi:MULTISPECIES: hypothetical protein [Lactobacillus]|uniref:hypothetical protein n=1 Tax=Lactobacillus TaxID=1578 RepID=UPI001C697E26|nr:MULTISPECIES: hypothetical protein [Lactobacillus]MCX8720754.1 hypothetical protein [Lactobacillus sp. B4010]MCX8723557.1 hypothetical protein [Lactobacillus sp. B4005]MCX8731790.1 hypothetical protein [Lactobacillus sp. B4015]MCX8733936.1 hypothetical protein [Lactobacillus sp. B4012]QYN57647.1 hypothetical protein GYM69_01490 [Lactobacillus panisapium]
MKEIPEDKEIEISTDYENQSINMRFSDNLTDDRERGYILSAAFFSFCASQGLSKDEITDMVSTYYDEFLDN